MSDHAELSLVTSRIGDDTFDITHYTVRGWKLFVVRGDLRSGACDVLLDVLREATGDGSGKLIVDLARVTAVDPPCVTELARIDQRLRHSGGDFRLVVDGVAVLQAIRAAGLSGRFEIHRYVGDIVGAVAGIDEGGRGRRRGGLPGQVGPHPAHTS
jgi:anti-anti-sigma regulatory factor